MNDDTDSGDGGEVRRLDDYRDEPPKHDLDGDLARLRHTLVRLDPETQRRIIAYMEMAAHVELGVQDGAIVW